MTFVLIAVGYSLAWFFFSTIVFLLRGGKAPSMRYSMALVLGAMSAALHFIVCYVGKLNCGLWP